MKLNVLFDKFLSLVFVPKCVGCGERLANSDIFCKECFQKYVEARDAQCPVCYGRIGDCTCANENMRRHGISKHIKLMKYIPTSEASVPNRMAYVFKENHNKKLNDFLAFQLALPIKKYIGASNKHFVITYIPRSARGLRLFGYDQSEELAKKVAGILGLPFEKTLKRVGGSMQKRLNVTERRQNASNSIIPVEKLDFSGKHYILIDDIVTTGSSFIAAKNAIKRKGASDVIAASLYIVGKC